MSVAYTRGRIDTFLAVSLFGEKSALKSIQQGLIPRHVRQVNSVRLCFNLLGCSHEHHLRILRLPVGGEGNVAHEAPWRRALWHTHNR